MRCRHTTIAMAKIKSLTIPSTGEEGEQMELPNIVGRNVKQHNHFGKLLGSFRIKLNIH